MKSQPYRLHCIVPSQPNNLLTDYVHMQFTVLISFSPVHSHQDQLKTNQNFKTRKFILQKMHIFRTFIYYLKRAILQNMLTVYPEGKKVTIYKASSLESWIVFVWKNMVGKKTKQDLLVHATEAEGNKQRLHYTIHNNEWGF